MPEVPEPARIPRARARQAGRPTRGWRAWEAASGVS